MSNIFIVNIVGQNDFAIPTNDAELGTATTELDALLSTVANLVYTRVLAWVQDSGGPDGAEGVRSLNCLLEAFTYSAEECPSETEVDTLTAAIESTLEADADITSIGTQYVNIFAATTTTGSIFEADVGNDEIQPVTAQIGRSFIVGSQSMDDSGAANDARMFFDKSKSAFRAGKVTGNQWDDANRGASSHAEGSNTIASGDLSHAEGSTTTASGLMAHSEGNLTTASGYWGAHAEGYLTTASGHYGAHAEGYYTTASGYQSHAEGFYTTASARASHSEGRRSVARLRGSHASAGDRFVVDGDGQTVRLTVGADTTATGWKDLAINYGAAGSDIEMESGAVWNFIIQVSAKLLSGATSYSAIIEGCAYYDGADINLIGTSDPLLSSSEFADSGASGWSCRVSSTTGSEYFVLEVNPDTTATIHWVATIHITEVIP